jgi:cytochrome P450
MTDRAAAQTAPGFDLSLLNPPWALFEQLRRHAPVFRIDELDAYLVSRYDDVHRILKDPKLFSSELEFGTGFSFLPATPEKDAALARGGYRWVATLGFTDPPVHKRVRAVVQRAFSPRRIRQLEGRVQQLCDEIIAGLDPAGVIDFAQEVALALPVMVIGDSLGVPHDDRVRFNDWSDAVLRRLTEQLSDEDDIAAIEQYVDAELYFAAKIAERRAQRTDDLLSDLVYAQQEADDPITDEELMSIVSFLPVAGSRTSAGLIGGTMHHLLEHPAEQARVREDAAYLDATIEEIVRLQSPIQLWFRRATEEVEVGGVRIPKDARILVAFASANHDDRKFGCPEEFRPGRENIKDHVAFGWGPHFCPGSSLARAEARIAISSFLARFETVAPAPGAEPHYVTHMVHRMADRLPVVVANG